MRLVYFSVFKNVFLVFRNTFLVLKNAFLVFKNISWWFVCLCKHQHEYFLKNKSAKNISWFPRLHSWFPKIFLEAFCSWFGMSFCFKNISCKTRKIVGRFLFFKSQFLIFKNVTDSDSCFSWIILVFHDSWTAISWQSRINLANQELTCISVRDTEII